MCVFACVFSFYVLFVSAVICLTQEDQFEDNYGEPEAVVDMSVVKRKSFPMPPVHVDEAVMCLDYIDHDCEIQKSQPCQSDFVYRCIQGQSSEEIYLRRVGHKEVLRSVCEH